MYMISNIFEKVRFFANQLEMLPFISQELMSFPEALWNRLNFI